MKNSIFAIGMALGAFVALSSCSELELSVAPEIEPGETDFTIVASSAGVRTSTDGYQTSWVAGDSLTIWHAVSGTTEYVKDRKFTTAESGVSASFGGTLNGNLDPATNYDWYAIYPYKGALKSPAGDSNTFVGTHSMGAVGKGGNANFGQPNHLYLCQTGNNSTAHLAKFEFAFAGRVLNVPGDTKPTVDLRPIFSVVKIVVTNKTSEPLHVFGVRFTAPGEPIGGQFAVDFTGDEFVYTPKTALTAAFPENFDSFNLEVRPDAAIPQNGSATYYLSVKPFTAAAGTQLKVKINGYEKTIDLASDCTFSAGKVKTINFSYDEAVTDLSGDYFFGTTHGSGDVYFAEAKQYTRGAVGGGTNTTHIAAGHTVSIEGNTITVDGCMEVCAADAGATIDNYIHKITKVKEGKFAGLYTIQNSDDKYLSYAVASGNDVQFKNNLQGTDGADSYWAIGHDADGTDYIVAPYSSGNRVYAFLKDALRAVSTDYVRATIYPYLEFQRFPTLYKCDDYEITSLPVKYYKLVTSDLSDWTGKYLIVNTTNSKCFKGSITDANAFDGNSANSVDVVIKDGKIAYGPMTTRLYGFNITKNTYVTDDTAGKDLWKNYDWNGSGKPFEGQQPYTIRAIGGNKWTIGIYGAAKLAALNHNSDERFLNFISYNAGNVIIKSINSTGGVTGQLKYNADQTKFRYFGNGSQQIQLYKLEESN